MLPFLIIAGVLIIVGIITIDKIKKMMLKKKVNKFLIKIADECENQVKLSAGDEEFTIKGRSIDSELKNNVGRMIYI